MEIDVQAMIAVFQSRIAQVVAGEADYAGKAAALLKRVTELEAQLDELKAKRQSDDKA